MLYKLNFMYYTPPQFLSNLLVGYQSLACIYLQSENSVESDLLTSKKSADLDLYCFKNRI